MSTVNRVPVKPKLISWARERAGLSPSQEAGLRRRFPRLPLWEQGHTLPTLKQLERFARAVYVPVGYLFLDHPPEEKPPIADFRSRTFEGDPPRWSPHLLETVYACQERQDWYRDFARDTELPKLDFVGSVTVDTPPTEVAQAIRATLDFDLETQRQCPTWTDTLSMLIRKAEDAGILVMVSGVVGGNNRRSLDPNEFRGFALADPWSSVIFINGADWKTAQIFTLAHELAHLWLGSSALSDLNVANTTHHEEDKESEVARRKETWCNAVAAELLVPLADLRSEVGDLRLIKYGNCEILFRLYPEISDGQLVDYVHRNALTYLARTFKVSTWVILRRLLTANLIDWHTFETTRRRELEYLRGQKESNEQGPSGTTVARKSRRFVRAGGDAPHQDAFRPIDTSDTLTLEKIIPQAGTKRTPSRMSQLNTRRSRRLVRALVGSTLAGDTLYRDAFRMLDVPNSSVLREIGREAGVTG